MSQTIKTSAMGLIEPHARLKQLANHANTVQIDPSVPIQRYYRSGMEMVRMANVYLSEGNLENAYILYMKFMTLFIEKIQSHPDYKKVPAITRKPNQDKLKEVLPVTENLKVKLLDKFQKDYARYLVLKETDRAERAEQKRRNEKSGDKDHHIDQPVEQIDVKPTPTAPNLEQVVYPNDFPTGSTSSSVGLILPDVNKSGSQKPAIDRNLKPDKYSDSLMEGYLREVLVPHNTMVEFLKLAKKNTSNNVETCGILAGHLAQNRLIITHIIVPKQRGTSDSCNTMNEEEIFEIQDQQNLITLGWIHTHPSQTAFLSSVDMHTHCSYQIMMPEAIAIVCAPKYQTSGFFCLTPNYGLEYIAQCRQSGFHPHPNDSQLFMETTHTTIDDKSKIEVIDLR